MPHNVLQLFRINTRLCHIATKCMPCYMWGNHWKFFLVNLIILLTDMLKVFLPMQSNHRLLFLSRYRNPHLPSIIGSIFGFLRFSKIRLKHSLTSSDIGTYLTPFSILGVSMTYSISLFLCNWWSTLILLSSKSISSFVNPQNSEMRIPVWKRFRPLRNTCSRHCRHWWILGTSASGLL